MKDHTNFLTMILLGGGIATAAPTPFLDRAEFISHAELNGWALSHEGFESDAAWGEVRSGVPIGFHTAPSITNLGCEWKSVNPNGEVTTSAGAARTGQWGFFAYPHFVAGIPDGWILTFDPPLKAVGGFVRTNTPPMELGIFVNGAATPLDFGENETILQGPYRFFGVADPDGISTIRFFDLDAGGDEYHNIFGDDFEFARPAGCIGDINGDGLINFTDLNALLGAFGQSGPDLPGDLNSDGVVDFADLNELLSLYGTACN
jgi:hypothetical protein